MSKIKNELEDLAFQHLEPQTYATLRAKVESRRKVNEGIIEELKKTVTAKLADAQVPVVHIEGRIKRLFSIAQKLRRQKVELEQVYDLVALRIVTPSVKDCYAALGIIHHTWSPVPGRIKDFIAMPRPNGYQSLHTSVVSERGFPFEVQIRTVEMHRISEEGIAAHWKYKEGRVGADRDEQYYAWLRQLLEVQQDIRDPQEFIQSLKVDLYREEVYVFTPRGEVKVLPAGATPVDFAYLVHTDVGHQCVGARVNGKMVPLRTRLKNGDIVEIVTTPGHKPSRDWLNFVATSKARSKIRHLTHSEEKARSIDLGRKLFEKEARRFDVNLKAISEPDMLARAAADQGLTKPDDLFAAIGYGKIAPRSVLAKLVPQDQLRERPPDTPIAQVVKRVLGTGEQKIKVRGFDDLMVARARCCNPIRGEPIVGYITRGKGVSVHSATCPNVLNLLYDPERRIDVEWDKGTDASPYTVRLAIQVEDRKGLLADVSAKIAGINTNIRDVEATTDEQDRGRINMTVEISDMKHLEKVIKSLRGVKGVLDVARVGR
jgi:GTP pyrophosphokinase